MSGARAVMTLNRTECALAARLADTILVRALDYPEGLELMRVDDAAQVQSLLLAIGRSCLDVDEGVAQDCARLHENLAVGIRLYTTCAAVLGVYLAGAHAEMVGLVARLDQEGT